MAPKDGKKVLGIVISVEDYNRLELLAKQEDRSVSNYSLRLLLKALNEVEGKRD